MAKKSSIPTFATPPLPVSANVTVNTKESLLVEALVGDFLTILTNVGADVSVLLVTDLLVTEAAKLPATSFK